MKRKIAGEKVGEPERVRTKSVGDWRVQVEPTSTTYLHQAVCNHLADESQTR